MDKDKLQKKRGSDAKENLPIPPPSPYHQQKQQQQTKSFSSTNNSQILPDAFHRLLDYKDRETTFLKVLNETIIMDCKKLKSESEKSMQFSFAGNNNNNNSSSVNNSSNDLSMNDNMKSNEKLDKSLSEKSDCEQLRDECENYIMPLLNRTGPSISAALVAHDAFEQLNRLHGLLDQMLTIQEQNYQMRRYLRDVRTLCELKKLQKKESNEILNEADELSDTELDLDNQVSLLTTILAAGNSASTKRSSAKRQREHSKSVIGDDIQIFNEKDNKLITQRRQSAFSETKAKVSKWTKVKAAFKWERANVPALNEGKSSDSGIGLVPINHEVARYLRVPSVPCTGSSADSILSSSSGHLLSCGSIPATPGTISSASSTEDFGAVSEDIRQNRDSSKSDSRCDSRANEEETRRSRSLDGDAVVSQIIIEQKKDKTAWRKVKDIIQTHRGSFKGKSRSRSIKSNESITQSRDVSPCESLETVSNIEDRTESTTSPLVSPTQKCSPSLNIGSDLPHQDSESFANSSCNTGIISYRDENDAKLIKAYLKGPRRSKVLSDFESLPEGVVVDLKSNYNKLPPSPLNLSGRQDSSDTENIEFSHSPTIISKSPSKVLKVKKSISAGNSSVPSSPSRHSEFFGEFESEELSSGDFSEPCTPHRKLSPKSSLQSQQDEINEKYLELKYKLNQEFELKRQEWEKIRSACCSTTTCAFQLISKDESLISTKNTPPKSLEDNLSADFKRKLHKWRVKKQFGGITTNVNTSQTSPTKENEPKKIDWNLWKTGQIKLEGQGLQPLPDQKNLPEEFQKKLEQWKKMKETNSVPTYNNQDSLKRKTVLTLKSEGSKKGSKDEMDKNDREKQRDRDKSKTHEKDKLEKLSKLKAIVADPRAKEIEVQTSKGIMKFEGISRKFTRKLYEWEKARGIGPEMSTFALLHPGYRPLDVGNGSEENKQHENSPTLGRSLSLDSVSPNTAPQQMSHQPSSLSLNDMDDLKESSSSNDRRTTSNPELNAKNQQDEPEAVIVEVEDDIVETAAPLLTAIPIIEQQTPVYKYEASCSQICAGKKETLIQDLSKTYPSTEKLSTKTLQNVNNLTYCLQNDQEYYKKNINHVQKVLSSLKDSLPELERCTREGSPHAKDALNVAKNLIKEIVEMLSALSVDEAESKESLSTKTMAIDTKLRCLQKSINLICKYVETHKNQVSDQLPEINVTSDDGIDKSVAIVSTTPTIFQSQVIVNQPKILMGSPLSNYETGNTLNLSQLDVTDGLPKKMNRNVSNGSKKKMRLRKMGSRQNSKTESDSTSDEETTNLILEAPRRVKRKTSRAKKITEDEKKYEEKKEEQYTGDDIVYVLKIKPGQVIEQKEIQGDQNDSKFLISPTESCVQLMEASQENLSNSANVFVKTKRKIFTTIEEPAGESKTAVVKDLESTSSASDRNEKECSESEKLKPMVESLSSLQSNSQEKLDQKSTPPKEPSTSIRIMIAKYNEKIATDKSPQIGSILRSPVSERRVRDQKAKYEVDHVIKSASAGTIRQSGKLTPVEISLKENNENKIKKSCSADVLPHKWESTTNEERISPETDICTTSLACDSLQIITKNCSKDEITTSEVSKEVQKKEHLYRKNKEKPTNLFSKTGAIRKIGTKNAKSEFVWQRCLSDTHNSSIIPDKSDNTVPKITRKLEMRTSSDRIKSQTKVFDINISRPSTSAPTTPSEETGRPKTPLSERAMKLRKAKEEFLRASPIQLSYLSDKNNESNSKKDEFDNDDEIWKKRLSQVSIGSDTSNDECILLKSASVGLIGSGVDDNQHLGGYVSLPRNVSRSGKIISKFGFSTLASKFRKVKMRRTSKDSTARMNTVSTLCRQSLAIDIMPSTDDDKLNSSQRKQSNKSETNLTKSGSTQAITFGTLFRKNEKDKLNKSKSTGSVLNDNQS